MMLLALYSRFQEGDTPTGKTAFMQDDCGEYMLLEHEGKKWIVPCTPGIAGAEVIGTFGTHDA